MHVPCQSQRKGRVDPPVAGQSDLRLPIICRKNKKSARPAEKSREKSACAIRPGGRSPSRRAVNGRTFSITRARRYLFLEPQPERAGSMRPTGFHGCGKAFEPIPRAPYPPSVENPLYLDFWKSAGGELTLCRISLVSYSEKSGDWRQVRVFRYNRSPVGELVAEDAGFSPP